VSQVRVAFQICLHLLFASHVLAWYYLDWKSIGGLDFQEFFHNLLSKGVVTIAVVVTATIFLLSLVWGRLFCSWGCHFAAAQDLAAWILRRVGWRSPFVRTRFLHWLPFLLLTVIFLMPAVLNWFESGWSFQGAGPGGLLSGNAPWGGLPGAVMSIATFVVCGGIILLFLGRRGFCRFVCPYGAVFRVASLAAPWRVRRLAVCQPSPDAMGAAAVPDCTRACPTAIDVHEETSRLGKVVSFDCVHCHLCIEACPNGALGYSASSRPFATLKEASGGRGIDSCGSGDRGGPADDELPGLTMIASRTMTGPTATRPSRWTLTVGEELLAFALAIVAYAAFDQVYGGHFLAASLALAEAFLVLVALRAVRRRDLKVWGVALRHGGNWRLSGVVTVGVALLSLVPLYQAATFKAHRTMGLRTIAMVPLDAEQHAEIAHDHARLELSTTNRDELRRSVRHLERALIVFPEDLDSRRALCLIYEQLGDPRAIEHAKTICMLEHDSRVSLENLRRLYRRFARAKEAEWVEHKLEKKP